MAEVIFEVRVDEWRQVGSLSENEPAGSISSNEPFGRQVYVFGWMDGEPGLWRSRCGADVENTAIREITTFGFDRLADLAVGPFEMVLWRSDGPLRARFRLAGQEGAVAPDNDRVTMSTCRRCLKKLDAATGIDSEDRPTEDAVSICWHCGTLSIYTADVTLREPTIDEVKEMLDDEQISRVLSRMWDTRLTRVDEGSDGVKFACGCKTTAGAGLFTLEACSENCAAAQTIIRMARDKGTPFSVIR